MYNQSTNDLEFGDTTFIPERRNLPSKEVSPEKKMNSNTSLGNFELVTLICKLYTPPRAFSPLKCKIEADIQLNLKILIYFNFPSLL